MLLIHRMEELEGRDRNDFEEEESEAGGSPNCVGDEEVEILTVNDGDDKL